MQRKGFGPVVYVPTMHFEFIDEGISEHVRPVWPGLSARYAGNKDIHLWQEIPLPFQPSEASSCLAELSRLDESGLSTLAETEFQLAAEDWHSESRALASFAATGELDGRGEPDFAARRRWAQRFLLLGWLQEERVLEIETLSQKYRAGAEKLASQLGEAGDEDAGAGHLAELSGMLDELIPEDRSSLLPSWRFMLELYAILLPEGAVVCTADTRMLESFAAAGLCQEKFPEDLRTLFPHHVGMDNVTLSCGEEPFWKLLGKKSSQSDRPWLDRRQLVILFHKEKAMLEQA